MTNDADTDMNRGSRRDATRLEPHVSFLYTSFDLILLTIVFSYKPLSLTNTRLGVLWFQDNRHVTEIGHRARLTGSSDLLLWPGAGFSLRERRELEDINVLESLPTRVKGTCFLPATRMRKFLCVGSLKEVSEIPGGG